MDHLYSNHPFTCRIHVGAQYVFPEYIRMQRNDSKILMLSIDRSILFKLKGTWDSYPRLHFHCLVQEDCDEGDGVDRSSKREDIDIRVFVGLQRRNKQVL